MMVITTTLQPEGEQQLPGTCDASPTAHGHPSLEARVLPTVAVTLPAQNLADLQQQRQSGEQFWSCLLPPGLVGPGTAAVTEIVSSTVHSWWVLPW